ncbi:MAG: hypothetical protein GY724_02890 [Actinomycetia bacterium]|nr:hypothetical protein [Actinomycetes bacterium]MCP4223737.1 hypothetical protein [Actinomycetes bacterium]MCP5030679.1 hypothetical protein [Actinomycetes bacterium]
MAILYSANLRPSKLEMISSYLVTLPFMANDSGSDLTTIGAYRFDDPAGDVGIETHLVRSQSVPLIQLPLTYRGAPLAGGEAWLLGTMEHSVLGRRWVYNACGDPVYVAELVRAMLTGGSQVDQFVETEDGPVKREPTAVVSGSGTPDETVPVIERVDSALDGANTSIRAAGLDIVVRHVFDEPVPTETQATLSGTWSGADDPVVLAFVR